MAGRLNGLQLDSPPLLSVTPPHILPHHDYRNDSCALTHN